MTDLMPVSGLHFAILTEGGGLLRYPIVGADAAGLLYVTHRSLPRLICADDLLGDAVATATVSASLPREQVMRALQRQDRPGAS